ncbi:hypothetical protein [Citrobacter pasteurii]|nr:hypothetical protein SF123566_3045 [Shigella flexneri 1235-66]CEJ65815.1 hypothetical protein [Citrobacter pasteurii]
MKRLKIDRTSLRIKGGSILQMPVAVSIASTASSLKYKHCYYV